MNELSLEKKRLFEELPVGRAIFSMALPAIVGQLITLIYNWADSIYIGLLNNASMTAAMGFAFPSMMLMVMTMNFFSMGGASVISRALGNKDLETAKDAAAVSIYGGLFLSAILSVLMMLFAEELCLLLGAQQDGSLPYLKEYVFWTAGVGAIPTIMGGLLSNLIRSDGNATHAGIAITLGGVMNIALDPLFIFVFDMNVKGAAIATMLSNCITLLYCVIYLVVKRKKSVLSLNPRRLKALKRLFVQIALVGAPASLNALLVALANAFMNNTAVAHGEVGEIAVGAFGIVRRIDGLPWGIMFGLTQGIVPLIGYNYAAKNNQRMKEIIKKSLIFIVVFDILLMAIMLLFAPYIMAIFTKNPQITEIGAKFMRAYCPAVLFMSIGFIFNAAFQAFGKGWVSLLLTIGRMGVMFIPVLFILDAIWGLDGIMFTQPIAEFFFALTGAGAFLFYLKRLKKKESELSLPLPQSDEPTEPSQTADNGI